MSDLFDKRTDRRPKNVTDKKADKAARKQAKTAEQMKSQKKTRIISILVVSVFLLFTLGAILLNSGFIRREVGVINIGGIAFSAAEFDFFYNNAYEEYAQWVNQLEEESGMPGLTEGMLPVMGRSFKEQIYDEETGQTWADFITDNTISRMEYLVQVYNAAKADGFELSEDELESLHSMMDSMAMQAEASNFPSVDDLVRQYYGPSMSADTYLRLNVFLMTVDTYEAGINPEISITQADIDEAYIENRNEFDVYHARVIEVSSEEFGFEESSAWARDIASRVETEDDFITEALNFNPELYSAPDSTMLSIQGGWLPEFLSTWFTDESRAYGDVTVLDDELNGLSYIIFYLSRDDNKYQLVNIRQMVVAREREDAILTDDEARVRAEELEAQFREGGATPEAMEAIVFSHIETEDLDGGHYTNIGKVMYESASTGLFVTKMAPEVEEWLFAPGRQVGDFELIRSESFGYHIVYIDGFGDVLSDIMVEDYLTETGLAEARQEWRDSLAPVGVSRSWLFSVLTNR